MALPARMKFGIFMALFHPLGENPTLALDRDLELIQWLDHLGYDDRLDFRDTIGHPIPRDRSPEEIADQAMSGTGWIVGSPDDAIAALRRLDEMSGGYGGLMFVAHEWTSREKILRSYELFARYVIPQFQGSLVGVAGSDAWAQARSAALFSAQSRAIEKAHTDFQRPADGARP